MKVTKFEIANALATSPTITEACKVLGISRATLYKYKADVQIQNMMNELNTKYVNEYAHKLIAQVDEYNSALRDLAFNSDNENIRLNALKTLIDQSKAMYELSTLNAKIKALETKINECITN